MIFSFAKEKEDLMSSIRRADFARRRDHLSTKRDSGELVLTCNFDE